MALLYSSAVTQHETIGEVRWNLVLCQRSFQNGRAGLSLGNCNLLTSV
jgi:hypothetical protein